MIRLVSKYLFRSPQLVASSTIRDVTTTTPQNYRAGLFTLRQSDNAATYEVFCDMINYEKVCLLELKKKFLHNFEQKFDWRKLFGLKVATVVSDAQLCELSFISFQYKKLKNGNDI